MLRKAVIALGGVCFAAGLIMLLTPAASAAFGPLAFGALLLVGTLWERIRYKPIEEVSPGGPWTRTSERFIDEETGETVTVWIDPATGERKYVKG
ncbi:MAG TPA: hypothetical protein VHC42_09855 [Rhizomicrobium sp.]|nr:hypothetical protein [Rhizomicrobium sp.]